MDKNQLLQTINKFYQQKNWQKMEKVCTEGLQFFPTSASTLYNRGIAKAKLKNFEGAMQDLERSLKIKYSLEAKHLLKTIKEQLPPNNQQSLEELSPSQLFERDKEDLINIFSEKSRHPEQIGPYKIISELGAGGMGKVYKAHDSNMNRIVAIKVILPGSISEKVKNRFLSEAKIMAKLRHHNIITIYDVVTNKSTAMDYIVMDFIEGEHLSDKDLSTRQSLQIIRDISLALDYAHQQGIIHRDLKPANIMLKNGKPIVMDFGLAKNVKGKDITQSGAMIGTPRYMAPEQAASNLKAISPQTDVYALGVILYELLIGKPAIEGETLPQIIFNILQNKIKPLRKHNPLLAPELEIICAKATDKEIGQRYDSVTAFADDIARFLNGELIKAKSYGFLEKNWRKLKQNKLIVLAALTGFLIIVAGVWFFEKDNDAKIYPFLTKVKKLQQQANKEQIVNKKIESYAKVNSLLEKALLLSPNNLPVKNKLIAVQKKIGILAKKQKNYLLSATFFQRCKKMGYKQADELLKKLEQEKNQQEKKDGLFINKAMKKMQKISRSSFQKKEPIKRYADRYTFLIVKIQRPYIIKLLVPYLITGNKWQRLLAIKALGKFGNKYSKFKNKDSVEWLMARLAALKNKKAIKSNQEEVEEIIWALGWLKDSRSNKLVYEIRWLAKPDSPLWNKTKIPYKWIPINKKTLTKDAQQLFIRGCMRDEKGDYKGALTDFSKVIELNPKFAVVYNNRANVYQTIKEYSKAIADLNKAIKLNPRLTAAYNNRAIAYKAIKEYIKAIADFNKAIELDPNSSSAYNNRANIYKDIKEYSKAIADFNKAIELNPRFSKAYNNRALTHKAIKKHTNAIADFSKAIKLNPRFTEAYNNRANIYKDIKEYAKALADYKQTIELNPRLTGAYSDRALVYKAIKEYTKAIADCNQAIKLNPKFTKAYNNRAITYLAIKEYTKAIADCNQAIKLNPKYPKAYNNRASAYLAMKEYAKAFMNYNQAVKLNPKFFDAYYNRAFAYLKIREHAKAITDFNKAIELNPGFSSAYYNRALAYIAYVNRASSYLILKKYQKAYKDYSACLKLAPNHPTAPRIHRIIKNLRENNQIK